MLDEARAPDPVRALIVDEADNPASVVTIEHDGGVLGAIQDIGLGPARRYRIGIRRPRRDSGVGPPR